MKKVIVWLDLHDDKDKQKAIKAVSTITGIDSISMDMKERKMTVIGDADPVSIASKLRKHWQAVIVSVGPAKEPEKKEETKKEEAKKEEPKKEEEAKKEEPKKEEEAKEEPMKEGEAKKEDEKKGEGEKKEEPKKDSNEQKMEIVKPYRAYHPVHPYMTANYPYMKDPNEQMFEYAKPCRVYNPYMLTQNPYMATQNPYVANQYPYMANPNPYMSTHYHVQPAEENPNACSIL